MALRAGMSDLILRVRGLTKARTDEYDIDAEGWWSDQHIQDTLDSHSTFMIDAPLTWLPQSIGGGTVTYLVCAAEYRDFETAASGTARWIVRDGPGAEIGTANYTADYRSGRISFTTSQGGTAYYLTGYSYDINAAAADIWAERAAYFSDWYDFQADGQRFQRQQAFEHAEKMEKILRARAGANVVTNAAGEIRMAQFVRTDIG